jgi:hypothetical protein
LSILCDELEIEQRIVLVDEAGAEADDSGFFGEPTRTPARRRGKSESLNRPILMDKMFNQNLSFPALASTQSTPPKKKGWGKLASKKKPVQASQVAVASNTTPSKSPAAAQAHIRANSAKVAASPHKVSSPSKTPSKKHQKAVVGLHAGHHQTAASPQQPRA